MATQFAPPEYDARVEVVTDWSDSVIARQNRTTRHLTVGTVVRNAPWDERGTFNLRTDRNFIANIELRRVVALRYLDRDVAARTVEVSEAKPEPEQTWTVTGSKGDQYVVTFRSKQWFCTCKGFGFRRRCAHIDEAKELAKLP